MAKLGIDETTCRTYMEDVEKCFDYNTMEFKENGTLFCQNKTVMSEKKIKEWVTSGPARVLIDKTHKLLLGLLKHIRKESRKEGATFHIGPAIATLKHYNLLLWKIHQGGHSR